MSYDFGIYFGGCSMVIAYCRDGKADVIVNEAGDRTTPAYFSINNNEYSIGLPAKQNLIRNSENTVVYEKYFLNKSIDDQELENVRKKFTAQVTTCDNEIAFNLEKDEKPCQLKLNEVITLKLKYLNDLAKSNLGLKDTLNAVISVPSYFTPEQASALEKCTTNAGFNVIRIIKNPLAACLAYDLEDDNLNSNKILVYQMGSSCLEITIIELFNGLYRKIDSLHTFNIGGDNFNEIVMNILIDEFKRKHKLDPTENKRSLSKLKTNAEYLKSILSTMERAHCTLDALFEGIDFDHYLTRQRFEGSCGKAYETCLSPIDELLKRNNLKHDSIDKVILCGAATKMCKLQALIKDKFPKTTQLLNQQSPDEIIAIGSAKQCSVVTNSKYKKFGENDTKFQCLSNEIFMRIGSETNENKIQIFPLYAPIPIKRKVAVTLDEGLPQTVFLYENLNDKLLTKIDLSQFTTKELSCLFQIKLDGTFEINITEISTNQTITEYLNSES